MNLIPPEINSYEFKSFFEFNSCGACPSPFRQELKEFKEFKEIKEFKEFKEFKGFNSEPDLNSYEFNSPRIQIIWI